MKWLAEILTKNTGGIINSIKNLIDTTITNKEERDKVRNDFFKIINDGRSNLENELTTRLQIDTNSDSWLTRNIRPLTLIVVLIILMIATVAKGFDSNLIDTFKSWGNTAIMFYFGSRGVEKVIKLIKK